LNSNNLLKDFTISKRQDPRKNNHQVNTKELKEISIIGVPEGGGDSSQNQNSSENNSSN